MKSGVELTTAIIGLIGGFIALALVLLPPLIRRRRRKPLRASTDPVAEIEAGRRPLRCGIVQHMPLAGFDLDERGAVTPKGYYAELMNACAGAEGIALEWIAVPWSSLGTAFSELDCDIVLSVFEDTRRSKFGDFILPFFRIGLSGAVRANDDRQWSARKLSDPGAKIVVSRGEVAWHYVLDDLGLPRNRVLAIDSDDLGAGIDLVKSGRGDILLVDTVTAMRVAREHPEMKAVMRSPAILFYKNCVFVRPGADGLRRKLRSWLTKARKTPEMVAAEARMVQAQKGIICRI